MTEPFSQHCTQSEAMSGCQNKRSILNLQSFYDLIIDSNNWRDFLLEVYQAQENDQAPGQTFFYASTWRHRTISNSREILIMYRGIKQEKCKTWLFKWSAYRKRKWIDGPWRQHSNNHKQQTMKLLVRWL